MSYGAHTHWLFCLNRVTQPGDSKDQSSRSFSWYRKQTAIATAPLCVLFPAPPPPPYRNVFFLTTGPDSSSSSSSIPSSSYSSSFLSLSIVEALCDLPFSYRLEKTIYPTRLPFTHNTSLTQYPSSCKPRPGRHMNWSSRIYQSEPALILLMRPLYSLQPPSLPPDKRRPTLISVSLVWLSLTVFSFYTSKDEAAVLAVERWKIGHLYAEDSWPPTSSGK